MDETNESIFIAEIGSVTENGVTLIFPSEASATSKNYSVNADISLAEGDRVVVCEISGSYVVLCKLGAPMTAFPIPSGGTDGQLLTKDGSEDYQVRWGDNPLPAGGTAGQVLAKRTTSGDRDVQWYTVAEIPTGGTTGQVLTKNSNTAKDVKWADATATKLGSATSYVQVANLAMTPSSTTLTLGSTLYPFTGVFLNGAIRIGTSAYASTLGFFGTTPVSRQSVASTATVSDLITALKKYGLIA